MKIVGIGTSLKQLKLAKMEDTLRDKILKALMDRYGNFTTIRDVVHFEDADSLLMNIAEDLNDEPTEEQIMEVVRAGIDPFYK
jgi:hypothetical protein